MPEPPPQAEKKVVKELSLGGKLVRYGGLLFIIAAACVGLINLVYAVTKKEIIRQQREKMLVGVRAIFDLTKEQTGEIKTRRNVPVDGKRKTTFFSHNGKVACVVRPIGYDGPITMIVGYRPAESKVLGIYVVAHTETPGFGARIREIKSDTSIFGIIAGQEASEPSELDRRIEFWFQQKFYDRPAPDFEAKEVPKTDAITGATITSQAVYEGICEAVEILKKYNPESEN